MPDDEDAQQVRLNLAKLNAMPADDTYQFLADLSKAGVPSAVDPERAPEITLVNDSGVGGAAALSRLRESWRATYPDLLSPMSAGGVDTANLIDSATTVKLVAASFIGPPPDATELVKASLGNASSVPGPTQPTDTAGAEEQEGQEKKPTGGATSKEEKTPVPSPAATVPTPGQTPVGFPAVDLTDMLKPMWDALAGCAKIDEGGEEPDGWTRQQQVASLLWAQILDDRAAQTLTARRQSVPEIELLEWALEKEVDKDLIEPFLKVRLGTPDNLKNLQDQETEVASAATTLAKNQAATVEKANVLLDDAHHDRTTWRELASVAKALLTPFLVVSVIGLFLIVLLLFLEKINGYESALLIFVVALFSISPIVLLLLERPLQGIDKFSPGAQAETAAETKKA